VVENLVLDRVEFVGLIWLKFNLKRVIDVWVILLSKQA
jgi:hypothetical protein